MHHQGHCEGRRAFWSGVSATGSDAPSKLGPNRPLGDDRFKKASGCAARHGENFGSIPWRLSLFINALRTKKQRQKDTDARWTVQFGKARPSLRPLQRFALHRIQAASFDGTAERSQVVQTVGIFDFRQPQGIQVFRITLYL